MPAQPKEYQLEILKRMAVGEVLDLRPRRRWGRQLSAEEIDRLEKIYRGRGSGDVFLDEVARFTD